MLMLVPIETNFTFVHGALLLDAADCGVESEGAVGREASEHAAAATAAPSAMSRRVFFSMVLSTDCGGQDRSGHRHVVVLDRQPVTLRMAEMVHNKGFSVCSSGKRSRGIICILNKVVDNRGQLETAGEIGRSSAAA